MYTHNLVLILLDRTLFNLFLNIGFGRGKYISHFLGSLTCLVCEQREGCSTVSLKGLEGCFC